MKPIFNALWNTLAFIGLFATAGFFMASRYDLRHWYITLGGALGFAGCWKALHFFKERYHDTFRKSA